MFLPGAVYDVVVHLVVGEGAVLVDGVHSTKIKSILRQLFRYRIKPHMATW